LGGGERKKLKIQFGRSFDWGITFRRGFHEMSGNKCAFSLKKNWKEKKSGKGKFGRKNKERGEQPV
jgi:hypothetical protein